MSITAEVGQNDPPTARVLINFSAALRAVEFRVEFFLPLLALGPPRQSDRGPLREPKTTIRGLGLPKVKAQKRECFIHWLGVLSARPQTPGGA